MPCQRVVEHVRCPVYMYYIFSISKHDKCRKNTLSYNTCFFIIIFFLVVLLFKLIFKILSGRNSSTEIVLTFNALQHTFVFYCVFIAKLFVLNGCK